MSLSLFSCKHPAAGLAVERESTTEVVDVDFNRLTYHLWCQRCHEPVKIVHVSLRGGVDAFLQRAKAKR